MSSSDSFKEVQRAHKYLQAFQRAHYGPLKVIAVTPCTLSGDFILSGCFNYAPGKPTGFSPDVLLAKCREYRYV